MPSVGKQVEEPEITHTADVNGFYYFGKLFNITYNSKNQETTQQPKSPSMVEWIIIICYTNILEFCLAMKMRKLLLHAMYSNLTNDLQKKKAVNIEFSCIYLKFKMGDSGLGM